MAKHHNLKQTKTRVELRGLLTKTFEDGNAWLTERQTQSGKDQATARIAVKTAPNNVVYGIELTGYTSDKVFYTQTVNEEKQKIEVEWPNRYDKKLLKAAGVLEDATLFFAKTIGTEREKYIDEKDGNIEKERTITKRLTAYDTVQELKTAREKGLIGDGTPVYVRGQVQIDSWVKDNKLNKFVKLIPDCVTVTNPIDLESLDEEQISQASQFRMEIVIKEFNEVEGETYFTGILVGYDFIDEMEFKIEDPEIVNYFKAEFQPHIKKGIYPMIECVGYIKKDFKEENIEEVASSGGIGKTAKYDKKRTGSAKTVWLIEGAFPSTIDVETYTAETVAKAKEELAAYANDYKAGREAIVEETSPTAPASLGKTAAYNNSMDDFKSDDDDWDF